MSGIAHRPMETRGKGLPASLLVTFIFTVFNFLPSIQLGILRDVRSAVLVWIVLLFSSFIMFMILYTGKIGKWRRVFFTVFAAGAAMQIIWWSFADRGYYFTPDKVALYGQIPMCHIVSPMLYLPIIFKKEIIFPAFLVNIAIMLLLITVTAVIYGRAFCAWGCLLGGQDELFSSMGRKKTVDLKRPHPFLKYFPFAMLVFVVLMSFSLVSPAYCVWFCPFRVLGDAMEVNSTIRAVQAFIFFGLWFGLVVVGPLLTKKRIQCGLFCPMGAFLSLTNKINLFDIKIDKTKCNSCKYCIGACPTFSITDETLEKGKASITCTKCGVCIEQCRQGAIALTMKGVPFTAGDHPLLHGVENPGAVRKFIADLTEPSVLFTFGILWLATGLATPYLVDALSRTVRFALGL